MTADVNAAIRGARAGGATEVIVKDSHGNSKNLLLDQLEAGTHLISGHGAGIGGMMAGIDRSFACALLVGYHAMAGTEAGIMEHTVSGQVHRLKLNGNMAGEIALSAAIAGCFDVPIVAVTSDYAGCKEALELLPGVHVAAVKRGHGRYMGECLPAEQAEALIFEAARQGVEAASQLDPWLPELPTTASIEFNRSEEADMAARLPGIKRTDAYTVEYTGDMWVEVHRAIWAMIAHASLGGPNNQ